MREAQEERRKISLKGDRDADDDPIEGPETEMAKAIYSLAGTIFDTGKIPQNMLGSTLTFVHKKGDRMDCSNFRGIALIDRSGTGSPVSKADSELRRSPQRSLQFSTRPACSARRST